MDWNAVIERNREALKRILASLVAMAGLAARPHPEVRAEGEPRRTLPRHRHRAVLRLLRPAEAAVRRLVIVAALAATPQARKTGDLVVSPPAPPRPRKPQLKSIAPVLRSLGIAVVISPADAARAAALARRPHAPRRKIGLPLFDPLRMPGLLSLSKGRLRTVPPHAAPRILSFDGARPHRLPPPPSPGDPIDATRLGLRLQALASALDDLPKHARRFARWRARRERGPVAHSASPSPLWGGEGVGVQRVGGHRFIRISPLRPGRPAGLSAANRRRPAHEIHDVLSDLQYFAFMALKHPDTS